MPEKICWRSGGLAQGLAAAGGGPQQNTINISSPQKKITQKIPNGQDGIP